MRYYPYYVAMTSKYHKDTWKMWHELEGRIYQNHGKYQIHHVAIHGIEKDKTDWVLNNIHEWINREKEIYGICITRDWYDERVVWSVGVFSKIEISGIENSLYNALKIDIEIETLEKKIVECDEDRLEVCYLLQDMTRVYPDTPEHLSDGIYYHYE